MEHTENNPVPGKWRQLMATIIMDLGGTTIGMVYGWTAAVIDDFQDTNNTLGIQPMSDNEISWLSSSLPLSLLLIIPCGSSLCERFGRKNVAIFTAIGLIVSWLMRLFTKNFYSILAAQILSGICDGFSALVSFLYVTEISSDAIRGQLGSLYIFCLSGGTLILYVIAAILSYKVMTACCLIVPIIYFLGLFLLPETPIYLLRKKHPDEAKRSLMWLRANDTATVEADQQKIEHYLETLALTKVSDGVKDLFNNWTNMKGLIISMLILLAQQMSGIAAMGMYIIRIINEVDTSINPLTASILYMSIQIVGCWVSTLTVERCGRRPLLLGSCLSTIICHSIIGIYLLLQISGYNLTGYGWLPVAAVIFFSFSYAVGLGPITIVISTEVFNPDLASICNVIFIIVYGLFAFVVLKVFPLITNTIGFHNCFFIFVLTSLIGFLIILFTIPETKGKSLESIREQLQKVDSKNDDIVKEDKKLTETVAYRRSKQCSV